MKNVSRLFRRLLALSAGVVIGVCGATAQQPSKWVYVVTDFSQDTDGWLASLTDYSLAPNANGFLDRLAEVRPLPEEVDPNENGFYVQSLNRPDDLFMFLKRPVTTVDGLYPMVSYKVSFYIEFASNAPSGCVGPGGGPDSVWLKAGASTVEPVPTVETVNGVDAVAINVDKSNQNDGGKDISLIGDIGNGLPCGEGPPPEDAPYVLLRRIHEHPEPVRADSNGILWLALGTDSGFESLTGLYYSYIVVELEALDDLDIVANIPSRWFGTAPFCKAKPEDCTDNGLFFWHNDGWGVGSPCFTGDKVLCVGENRRNFSEIFWLGTAPLCNASPQDCTDGGAEFVDYGHQGDGAPCDPNGAGTNTKVLCAKR